MLVICFKRCAWWFSDPRHLLLAWSTLSCMLSIFVPIISYDFGPPDLFFLEIVSWRSIFQSIMLVWSRSCNTWKWSTWAYLCFLFHVFVLVKAQPQDGAYLARSAPSQEPMDPNLCLSDVTMCTVVQRISGYSPLLAVIPGTPAMEI